jgi:ABC-type multidrug transport system fused ATPase/permease subunit
MRRVFARIVEIYKPFKWVVLGLFLFILTAQALELLSPYLYGKIIDAIVAGKKSFGHIAFLAVLAWAVYQIHSTVLRIQTKFELEHLDFDVFRFVSKKVLEKILSFSIGQHSNENSGIKQSVISIGEHSLTSFAYTMLYEVLPLATQVVLTIGVLFYLSWLLGLIVFTGILIFIVMSIRINLSLKDDLKKAHNLQNEMDSAHAEIIRNAEIVEINAQESRVVDEHGVRMKKFGDFSKKLWSRYANSGFSRYIIINLTRLAVVVIGAYYVMVMKRYTPGYLLIFFSWSSGVFMRVGNFGHLQRRLIQMYAAIKKLFVMMDVEPEVKVIDNPFRPAEIFGKIEFKNVFFAYPKRKYLDDENDASGAAARNDADVLNDIQFTISAGETVALVGPSGGGKSTIAKLLVRAWDPQKGQVIIDGNDLRIWDLKYYREHLGVVEQDVNLWDDTIRRNICFGLNGHAKDVRDMDLDAIAHMVCLDKFFAGLERGYETIVGEKGIRLSGGERQRVGIARALVKDPRILILDEATSHLDTENEALVHQSIENAVKGRTTVIIAHRLSTVKNANRIFLVDGGRIVGCGQHHELMKSSEIYCRLVNNQLVGI